MTADELDGRFGEAWSGEVPNGSHVNLVVARRGSATAAAIAGALASTTPGHAPFLVCLGGGNLVRPATVVRNKTTIENELIAQLTWGAAQIGIGQGVCDALAEGILDEELADELVLLVALWVDPAARDHTAVRLANRDAVKRALADAVAPTHVERTRALVAGRDSARNDFYLGE